uniref:GILT n=1 Tax=Metrobates hesperius TaxID=1656675 RepID=A0A483AGF0_9HEMI|nr:GILT [Metrobates hesperius]
MKLPSSIILWSASLYFLLNTTVGTYLGPSVLCFVSTSAIS